MLACRSVGAAVRDAMASNGAAAAVAATVWRNLLRETEVSDMTRSVPPLSVRAQLEAALCG